MGKIKGEKRERKQHRDESEDKLENIVELNIKYIGLWMDLNRK